MPAKVADASVLAAMAFNEPRGHEAAELLSDDDLIEPWLLLYELSSIVQKKILRNPENREKLLNGLLLVRSITITWVQPEDTRALASLALAMNLSAYDASYLQIAQSTKAELFTFDAKLAIAYRSLR